MASTGLARAEVTRVDVARRMDVGTSGYEKIIGTIHFAVDPKDPRNRAVVDLDKAPVTGDAQVGEGGYGAARESISAAAGSHARPGGVDCVPGDSWRAVAAYADGGRARGESVS